MFFFNLFENDENSKLIPAMKEEFNKRIRAVWSEEHGEMLYSVVDVVAVLSESADPKQYIKKMRARDSSLNSSWGTICTLTPGCFY